MKDAITITNLHKSFVLPHEVETNLKQKFVSIFSKKGNSELQKVLKGVSFEIKKGEFFGIVGRNGSGKSTLLKILAGIYVPDKGGVKVNGTLTPFIELGVGFNPDLTGRENVFLNGALLGFTKTEVEGMYNDIVDFAELEKFMDQRLKNYSSGMQVRLAFSIAIRAESDVLLLDEVLAVGDSAFQQKCYDYFATLKKNKKTVILVSHSMSAVERFCDRALLLEKGKIVSIGRSDKVASLYEDLFLEDSNKSSENEDKKQLGNKQKQFKLHTYIKQDRKKAEGIAVNKEFTISIEVKPKISINKGNIGINIRNAEGKVVFSDDSRRTLGELKFEKGKTRKLELDIENRYTNGKYSVDIIVVDEENISGKVLFKQNEAASFSVFGVRYHIHSMFHPKSTFRIEK